MNFLSHNNHIIVSISQKNYIVDTGIFSSFSYHKGDSIVINENTYYLQYKSSVGQFDRTKIEGLVNYYVTNPNDIIKIDGFIGMDIIGRYGLTINYTSNELEFDCSYSEDGLLTIPYVIDYSAVIIPNVTINGKPSKSVFDTGAKSPVAVNRFFRPSDDTGIKFYDFNFSLKDMRGTNKRGTISINGVIEKELLFEDISYPIYLFDSFIGPKDLTDKLLIIDVKNNVIKIKI